MQHALAHGDAAEPGAHRDREDPDLSHGPRPAAVAGRPCRCASSGIASRTPSSRGAHDRGCTSATQSRASSSDRSPDDEGHDALRPTRRRARRPPRRRPRPGARAAARPPPVGHVDAAADHHVVEPAEHLEAPVLVEPAARRRSGTSRRPAPRRSAPGRRRTRRTGSARRSGSARRRRSPRPRRRAAARRRRSRRRSRPTPYVATTRIPASARPLAQRRGRPGRRRAARRARGAAPPCRPASRAARCSWVAHEGDVRRAARGRDRSGQRRVLVQQHRPVAGDQRAADHLQPGDVRRRQGQHPRPGAAEPARSWPRPTPAPPAATAPPASASPSTPTSRRRPAPARPARPATRRARRPSGRKACDAR